MKGPEAVDNKLEELENLECPTIYDREKMIIFQVAWEMLLRGYDVSSPDSH